MFNLRHSSSMQSDDLETRIKVSLQLTLDQYCLLYKAKKLEFDPIRKNALQTEFNALKTSYIEQLGNIDGDLIWSNHIQPYFLPHLKPRSIIQNGIEKQDLRLPHTLQVLSRCFIELFKNSVDAITENYDEAQSENTLLEVEIDCIITDANITVIVKDNAGGFPDEYLQNIHTALAKKTYASKTHSHKTHNELSFGGGGIGLAQLCGLFLDGVLINGQTDQPLKEYEIPEGTTVLQISNSFREGIRGAEISLTSPIAPYDNLSIIGLHQGTTEIILDDEPCILNIGKNKLLAQRGITLPTLMPRPEQMDYETTKNLKILKNPPRVPTIPISNPKENEINKTRGRLASKDADDALDVNYSVLRRRIQNPAVSNPLQHPIAKEYFGQFFASFPLPEPISNYTAAASRSESTDILVTSPADTENKFFSA